MTKERKLVVYVGPYSFPNGGAAARRIYGNCLSLLSAGYDVIVCSGQLSDSDVRNYNGISVVSLNERKYERLPTLLKHLLYFTAGKSTVDWLDALERKPEAVILYSGYSPYLLRLLPWVRKNNVKLIFDAVEWYDPPNIISKLISPYYLNIEFAMRILLKKCDGLIVISEYLRKYYSPYVKKIIKVPPTAIFDFEKGELGCNSGKLVRFVYAGTPGKKDALSSIILAVLMVSRKGYSVQLHIAGVPNDKLKEYIPNLEFEKNEVDSVIKCHGILSHDNATNLVKNSDYSIILRPNTRSNQAGFPTKFVESMALGTPVIANLTSDLEAYIEEGVNGFICRTCEIDNIVAVLVRSVHLASEKSMRSGALETANVNFSPEVYRDAFRELIG